MKKITKIIKIVVLLLFTLLSCRHGGKKGTDGLAGDPELKIKSLTIFTQDAIAQNYKIEVENDVTELKATNVSATFTYGKKTEPITVTVTNGKLNIVGDNTITLSVSPIAGKHKDWNQPVTIKRKAIDMATLSKETTKFIDEAITISENTIITSESGGVFFEGRTVKLSNFAIAKTEIPYWLWYEVLKIAEKKGYVFESKGKEGSKGNEGASPTTKKNEPVTYVGWRDCIVWCNAFTEIFYKDKNKCVYLKVKDGEPIKDATNANECDNAYFDQTKKGFRLSTEAEWEYAARMQKDGKLSPSNYLSGATKDYTDDAECKLVAWYSKNSEGKTQEVGKRKVNALGLRDMSGNVKEWCWDRYGKINKGNEENPTGASTGAFRVLRGGGFTSSAESCSVGNRFGTQYLNASDDTGFRLAWYK